MYSLGHAVISSLLGYAAAAGVFVLAHYLRRSFPHLVYMLNISSHLLIYYTTLRLHFFSPEPLVPQEGIAILLLLIAIGAQMYVAVRRSSELLAGLGLVLALATAHFSDATHVMLPMVTATSVAALVLFARCGWWRVLLVSMPLVYFSHLIWLLGNPIMGHSLGAVAEHQNNLAYLFAYGAIFSLPVLVRRRDAASDILIPGIVLLNALAFGFMSLLVVLAFFQGNYVGIFSGVAVVCVAYSVFLKWWGEEKPTPALYACFGFMALSVAVYGYSGLPDSYLFLAWQSLLVVSMALWFRSRIIVVVNTLLYTMLLLVYLSSSPSIGTIDFSFALVALASARVMNWQRERLTLRTDKLRNVYLMAAFITVLYGLYHAVPIQYVTLSWIAAAAVYFLLSILLNNVKYRWMAVSTMIVSGLHLFVAKVGGGYRISAFLFLAVLSLGASLYYTKLMRKGNDSQDS